MHFLEEIKNHWHHVKLFTNDFLQGDFKHLENLAQKVRDIGSMQRLKKIKSSDSPLNLFDFNPALKVIICWDGGYVRVFLDKLKKYVSPHIKFYPMFSMSTETLETLPFKKIISSLFYLWHKEYITSLLKKIIIFQL